MHMYDNFTCVNDFFFSTWFWDWRMHGSMRWKKRDKKIEINISHQSPFPNNLWKRVEHFGTVVKVIVKATLPYLHMVL